MQTVREQSAQTSTSNIEPNLWHSPSLVVFLPWAALLFNRCLTPFCTTFFSDKLSISGCVYDAHDEPN